LKIKFKNVQKEHEGDLYINANSKFEFDYWKIGFEGNNSMGGWLLYKEIEYLVFPKIVDERKGVEQDLEKIEAVINSVGQFVLERDEAFLKLCCYQK
jgi:hypothetical protein